MIDKEVKARKIHKCDECGINSIKKGDLYIFISWRSPKYDKDDNQIGIEYLQYKLCMKCDTDLKEEAQHINND